MRDKTLAHCACIYSREDTRSTAKMSLYLKPLRIAGLIMARIRELWCFVTVVMLIFICIRTYLDTNAEFDTNINLSPPRSVHGPVHRWRWITHYRHGPKADYEAESPPKEKAVELKGAKGDEPNHLKKADGKKLPQDVMDQQAAVQQKRHQMLEDACKKYPELSKGAIDGDTKRHILVNEKQKLLYCFIPKVGCSNWKRVLMTLIGKSNKPLAEITSAEAHYRHGMRRLQAYNSTKQQQMLSTYKKFMYARNPFVRILSAYKNKYGDVIMYRKETYFHQFAKYMIRKYRENPSQRALETGENVTWTEFVKYLTDPVKYSDDHWEEMYKLCSPCKIKYDYIGQLETIGTDAQYMLQKLNLSHKVQFPSQKTSHPTNSTNTYESFFRELTIGQLKSLWKIYEKDFELFGYPKPDFMPSTS